MPKAKEYTVKLTTAELRVAILICEGSVPHSNKDGKTARNAAKKMRAAFLEDLKLEFEKE